MRLVKTTTRGWTFALSERERDFLHAVLNAYPAVPAAHQPLSRQSAAHLGADDEQLLHEALAEHRQANSARLTRWLRGGARFRPVGEEWRFTLARTDLNWMLQILNDVRVGHWLRLGSPDDVHDQTALMEEDPAGFFHMEAAGMFQMELLHACTRP